MKPPDYCPLDDAMTPEPISNVEVAKQQLSCAVELFFNKEHMAVVATLVFSAYGILVDLVKDKGCFRDFMQDTASKDDIASRDLWNEWNSEWGFLKHARSGLESKIINEDFIAQILFTAIYDFQLLRDKLENNSLPAASIVMELYQMWCYATDSKLSPCDKSLEKKYDANKFFPKIELLSKREQLNQGKLVMELWLKNERMFKTAKPRRHKEFFGETIA